MQAIQKRAGQTFDVTLERDGRTQTVSVTAISVREKGPGGQETDIGRIGVGIVTKVVRYEPYGPLVAVGYGWVRTWDMTVLTLKAFWKLVSRQIESSNIGGPIPIATQARRPAKEGVGPPILLTPHTNVNPARLTPPPVPQR